MSTDTSWKNEVMAEENTQHKQHALDNTEDQGLPICEERQGIGELIATVTGRARKRRNTKDILISVPMELNELLETQVAGAKSTACLGLIVYAIQELRKKNKTLDIRTL